MDRTRVSLARRIFSPWIAELRGLSHRNRCHNDEGFGGAGGVKLQLLIVPQVSYFFTCVCFRSFLQMYILFCIPR